MPPTTDNKMQPLREVGIISSALLERRECPPPSRINGKANPEYNAEVRDHAT
jgi:hypothetical protein